MVLYTVGHSNLPLSAFVANLKAHGVTLVVDVRSMPRSRFAPWSSQPGVAGRLAEHGIGYVYMGDRLGGRPAAETALYLSGIEELLGLAEERRVAVMCSEGDPSSCHRELMIGRTVRERGVDVVHISRGPGRGQ